MFLPTSPNPPSGRTFSASLAMYLLVIEGYAPGGHRVYVHDGGPAFISNGIELAVSSTSIVRDTGPYARLCVSPI